MKDGRSGSFEDKCVPKWEFGNEGGDAQERITARDSGSLAGLISFYDHEIGSIGRKEFDMAEKRTWGKWDGPQPPEGEGGLGSGSPPSGGSEAEGHSRQFVATCFKCGAQSYIGGDWQWFTCWKCGAMSTEMVA
jgi:hypothetical protein